MIVFAFEGDLNSVEEYMEFEDNSMDGKVATHLKLFSRSMV